MGIDQLLAKSYEEPLFISFLRHKGCTFCRAWLSVIGKQQEKIKEKGLSLVFVHMNNETEGQKFLDSFGIVDFTSVSDPEQRIYAGMGAKKAKFTDFLSFSLWKNTFKKAIFEKHGAGIPTGDTFQLGGFVILWKGKILFSQWADKIDSEAEFMKMVDSFKVLSQKSKTG